MFTCKQSTVLVLIMFTSKGYDFLAGWTHYVHILIIQMMEKVTTDENGMYLIMND